MSTSNSTTAFVRIAFVILLLVMGWLHIDRFFNGLTSPHGMEQAQIAREVARGNGLKTKVLRPGAIRQVDANNLSATLQDSTENTYHAPLKPLLLGTVFRIIGAQNFDTFRFETNQFVYTLDRVAAGFAVVCLILSIGITYILVAKIFDARIAGTTVLLMLFCSLFWDLAVSGVPQMLMLLFFTFGCYFAYRAFEITAKADEEEGVNVFASVAYSLGAAIAFTLLCLTHWIAVWVLVGYAIAAALFIRPRGVAGIIALTCLLIASVFPVLKNMEATGSPTGSALLVLFEGLAGSEEYASRSLSEVGLPIKTLVLTVASGSAKQFGNLYTLLGAIVAAPLFFLALLHPFKNTAIANFRWALLIMWLFAVIGMALFGLDGGADSSNQLHILFAPIMSAYGIAFVCVIWNRLGLNEQNPLYAIVPLAVMVLMSGGAFMLELPRRTVNAFQQDTKRPPAFPNYAPSELDRVLVDFFESTEIIASDQPWAVAWYADRTSLWLPIKPAELSTLASRADAESTPIAAVLLSPISNGSRPFVETSGFYGSYLSLILDSWASVSTRRPQDGLVSSKDPELSFFNTRYPKQSVLFFNAPPSSFITTDVG